MAIRSTLNELWPIKCVSDRVANPRELCQNITSLTVKRGDRLPVCEMVVRQLLRQGYRKEKAASFSQAEQLNSVKITQKISKLNPRYYPPRGAVFGLVTDQLTI